MKRTTIFVPEAIERDLRLLAGRQRRPTAAIVREALTEYIAHRQSRGALPSFTGTFDSGRADTAERHEELLFKALVPDGGAKSKRRRTAPISGRRSRRRTRTSKS